MTDSNFDFVKQSNLGISFTPPEETEKSPVVEEIKETAPESNTVPEGAFGIGSKETDDFIKKYITETDPSSIGLKDVPKAIFDFLKKNGTVVLPEQITEEKKEQAAKTQQNLFKPRSKAEGTFFRATAAGIVDIPNEIKHLSDWLSGNPYDPNELINLKKLGLEKDGDLDDAAYKIFKFGSGFLIPYGGFNKALKGIKLTGQAGKAIKGMKYYKQVATGSRYAGASAAADFFAIDKYDDNLFNYLAEIENPYLAKRFVEPIFDYLAAPERPEEGEDSNYGEAVLKSVLANTLFGEVIGTTVTVAPKVLPAAKKTLGPYFADVIDNVTGGPKVLNQKQMLDRTVQLFKDIKKDPTRLKTFLTKKKRLDQADLVGSQEFTEEFSKTLDSVPEINTMKTLQPKAKKTPKAKKGKVTSKDLPLQKSKPNPNVWGPKEEVLKITSDMWEATGKELSRVVIPDNFTVEAATAMGYDYLLPKVTSLAKKISPNAPEQHMRVLYLGAIKENKRLANSVSKIMGDIEDAFLLGETVDNALLSQWSEEVIKLIRLTGPTKKISTETAGTLRINQLIDVEPKNITRKSVDEEVAEGFFGLKGENVADRAKREKTQMTASDLVNRTKKDIEEAKLIPSKQELIDSLSSYIKDKNVEGLLGITRKVLAMQGDSKRLSKLVQGMTMSDRAGRVLDISNELFINSLLSAPETHVINIVGSLLNVAMGPLDLFVGSGYETTYKKRAIRELVSMFTTLGDNMKAAGTSLRLGKNVLDERRAFGLDASERYAIRMMGDNFFAKTINVAGHGFRIPSRLMVAGDEFAKMTAFRSHIFGEFSEQAAERGLKGKSFKLYVDSNVNEIMDIVNYKSFTKGMDTAFPDFVPDERILNAYQRAIDYAADRTFTSELGQGYWAGGTFGTKNLAKILKSSPLKPLVPFVTTPVNIGKHTLRRTGLPTAIFNLPPKYQASLGRIMKEHNERLLSDDLATAYRANGEATVGAGIWGYLLTLAAAKDDPESDLALIGGGHHVKYLKENELNAGELPYSFRTLQRDENGEIKRGDNGLPDYEYLDIFSRAEPFASILMIAGDAAYCRDFVTDEDYDNFAHCMTALMSRNINNKYMIQNIAQIFELTSDVSLLRRFYKIPVNYLTSIYKYPISLRRSIRRHRGRNWEDTLTGEKYRTSWNGKDRGRFPIRKGRFTKGDLKPQVERQSDIGDYEGNDFGSLVDENNPFQVFDTIGLMVTRELQDTAAGFNSDLEPIRNKATGALAQYPEGGAIGNPLKKRKEEDNPVSEYVKRIKFNLSELPDVLRIDDAGNTINLTTKEHTELNNLIPFIPINFSGKKPFVDEKYGKRLGDIILELSRRKNNIESLQVVEQRDVEEFEFGNGEQMDKQDILKLKKRIYAELQGELQTYYNAYKEAARNIYIRNYLDQDKRQMAINEITRSNKVDILRLLRNSKN